MKTQLNKPTETNKFGYNFYDSDNLHFEDIEITIGQPTPVFSDAHRGRKKLYDEIPVSSVQTYPNKVLGEDIPNHVDIIDRGDNDVPRYAVYSYVCNVIVNAATYDAAVQMAKTFLAIMGRDPKAIFNMNCASQKIYA